MNDQDINPEIIKSSSLDRRSFLKAGMVATAAMLIPRYAYALGHYTHSVEKRLSFYNTHTGESLDRVYKSRGLVIPDSLADINWILRDHRTGDVASIDVHLLDTLYLLAVRLGARAPFHVISGYRCQESNEKLRSTSSGVAKKSLHLLGKAVDIRLPGYHLEDLRDAALDLKRGGVGYYPESDFIHVDVGRVRSWPKESHKKA